MISRSSRYNGITIDTWTDVKGRKIRYLRRRFLPLDNEVVVMAEHIVSEDERLDNITARYLGDPEVFWRLCDANACLSPAELIEEVGRRLRIPLLQGR
jgi:hypothetical protein